LRRGRGLQLCSIDRFARQLDAIVCLKGRSRPPDQAKTDLALGGLSDPNSQNSAMIAQTGLPGRNGACFGPV
jgi:hypothetical protein